MKTMLIGLSLSLLALGASAQRKEEGHEGGHEVYRQRLVVLPSIGFGYGYGYGYPYYNSPYFGNPYFGNPYGYMRPYYHSGRMPYKLSLQIQSIKIEYRNKIRNTRRDKSISHAERRKEIRNLKDERDQAIINAQSNFGSSGRNNYQNNNPQ